MNFISVTSTLSPPSMPSLPPPPSHPLPPVLSSSSSAPPQRRPRPVSLASAHARPCMLLPPLRTAPPAPSSSSARRGLTLSDCSDLSSEHSATPLPRLPALASTQQPSRSCSTSSTPPSAPVPEPMSSSSSASTSLPPSLNPLSSVLSTMSSATSPRPHHHHIPNTTAPTSALSVHHNKPKKGRVTKSKVPGESRYWTPSEHRLFVEALLKFGPKNLKAISNYVGTRNMIQCRTHEQKYFLRLMRKAQRETMLRNGELEHVPDAASRPLSHQKVVYSLPSSCGISLLCAVGEEMARSLQE